MGKKSKRQAVPNKATQPSEKCNHGMPLSYPTIVNDCASDMVHNASKKFCLESRTVKDMDIIFTVLSARRYYHDVFHNASMKEKLKSLLLAYATKEFKRRSCVEDQTEVARIDCNVKAVCVMVLGVDVVKSSNSMKPTEACAAWKEMGEIANDDPLTAMAFVSKRVPCRCLKAVRKELKKEPRTSRCSYCSEIFERSSVKQCARCMLAQYCSEQCQRADWPEHKENCSELPEWE